MRRAALALVGTAVLLILGGPGRALAEGTCDPSVGAAYRHRLDRVLASGRDVWGERLLGARSGPTLDSAMQLLPPLFYAAGHGGKPLTATGAYYLPFTLPVSVGGPRGFGLHVADGSQILVRRVGGPHLDVYVGPGARERYGSCLRRLGTPRLAEGYLPILRVSYRDGVGARYTQESFVGRLPHNRSLVSFVRITGDAARPRHAAMLRLVSSRGSRMTLAVPAGAHVELEVAFVHSLARLRRIDPRQYDDARTAVVEFWKRQLPAEPMFEVPEPLVLDAERALEIQELEMTWRYSVGNTYEELSYAEALDVAQVVAAYGWANVSRQILRYTLRRLPARFTYWRAGERLVAGAQYFRLTGDAHYVEEELPGLAGIVSRLAGEVSTGAHGLLPRERYSSDIPDQIYSLQGQTLVWQGLLAMSRVWAATGHPRLAARSRSSGVRLESGLRRAVRSSQRSLRDGSLFVPAALLEDGAPFDHLTSSRAGTYWNLVVPYALASGFFSPGKPEAAGLLRYLLRHGARFLGLVRAGAYRLAGSDSSVSGTDQVYGVNVARFLADVDQPDQLVLSLYGTLAAALTPGTFVGGEAASVTPLGGRLYRSMYLPPNNDCAAAFLETLKLMLVHETRGQEGAPTGLELAFATPRAWLHDGGSVVVRRAPTSFGPVSYSIARAGGAIHVEVEPPPTRVLRILRLRLRLPAGHRISRVLLDSEAMPFDRTTGTIDLSGRAGPLRLTVVVVQTPVAR